MQAVFALILLFLSSFACAETIHLNDGSTVVGKIIEKTGHGVKIKVDGMDIVYYADEIWDIDGVPFITKKQSTLKDTSKASESQYQQIFKEATDAFVKGDYGTCEQMSQQAITIIPKPEAYNILAIAQFNQARYQEAAANYSKAIGLGLKPDPAIEKAMRPYRYREFLIKSPYGPNIPFKGKTNCSDPVIHNVFRTILSKITDPKDIVLIKPGFSQFLDNDKDFIEQWTVETKNGTKIFSLVVSPTDDLNAYIKVKKIKDIDMTQFDDLSNNPASAFNSSPVDEGSSLGSIFIDGRQWDSHKYYVQKNIISIVFSPQDGSFEELIYGVQNVNAETIAYERDLLRSWSTAVWQSLSPECSNHLSASDVKTMQKGDADVRSEQLKVSVSLTDQTGDIIKNADPYYMISEFHCSAIANQYQIARFETDQDAASMLMLMYRVDTPMSPEAKNKWAQNLDAFELKNNLNIKLIIQKIKDRHA